MRLKLLLLLALCGTATAQIVNGGGSASVNPTTGTIPVKSGATTFGDSHLVDSANFTVDVNGNVSAASITTTGSTADGFPGIADPSCSTSFLLWASTTTANTFKYCDANSNIRTLANQSGTSGGIPYYSSATTQASSAALTSNVLVKGGGAGAAPAVSLITENGTTATYTGTGGYVAPTFVANGANAGAVVLTGGTAQGHATASTVTIEAPATPTAYEIVLPSAASSGIPLWTNAANVVTESIDTTSGSGTVVCLTTSCVMTTPNVTTILDANAKVFIASSATSSAVDSITVTNAATANPATVTVGSSGTDTNVNLALNAKGSGTVQSSTFFTAASNRVTMTADWTCGTGGTVSSCASATIVGSTGTPLTFTLPLQALSWHWQCDGVVGQATAATANSWNFLTATNGATNVTASYQMNTAATAMTGGATTDTASTTTTVVIGPTWTLGGTATKMPFHISGSIEGASASGTVLSLQLVAPTVADLVTIYRGATCSVSTF